ncbi:MAG: hypothetical protein KUG67_01750 [Proteobacteria bacterium]|nr:hypothetical protein [Pseudomonadota bacterium]
MNQKIKGSALLLCSALLVACGGGSSGGGGGSSDNGTTFSGLVADGYLVNAKVCLDLNDNKACDDGEPSADTIEGGAFSFNASRSQIDNNPVILEATAGITIDEDTGVAVTRDFVLTAPAGSEFVSPLTTLVQAEIEAGSSVEQAIQDIQTLLGTDADLLEDYVAKKVAPEDPDDAEGIAQAAAYQRLHEIAQVATQVIAINAESMAEAAADQSSESTVGELFELVIAAVVEDIGLIADAVDDDVSEEFDPTTVLAVVEDDVGIDTTDIDDQVDQQQLEQDTDVADLGVLITSGGGLSWFELDIEDGAFAGAWSGTLTYDAIDEETTEFELEWVDGDWVEVTDDNDLVLTAGGWLIDKEIIGVQSLNEDGSIDVSFSTYVTLEGDTYGYDYNGEHISGRTMDVSGLEIAQFIGTEGVDASLYVGDAVFGDGAMAYRLTFTPTTDTYRIWDWECDAPLGGICNSIWHHNGDGDYSSDNYAANMSTVIVSEAASTEAVAVDASLLNAISAAAGSDMSIELVEGGAANFYVIDWSDGGSASKIGTGTWGLHTVGDEEAYVVSPEASIRSSLDLDAGEELMYAEYNGYVRQGTYIPAGASELDDAWSFNGTAWQNVQDNFSVGEPVEPLGCNYTSGWDEVTDRPDTLNSYTEFLSVVADCGGADTVTSEDIAGTTWVDYNVVEGIVVSGETVVFNNDGTLTFSDIEDGDVVETISGNWSVENSLVTVNIGSPVSFVDSWAIIDGTPKIYTEDDEWGSDLVLDDTADGEIWNSGFEKQTSSSNPTEFSTEWLAGKTLYDVWYGEAGPAVEKTVFSADGTSITVYNVLNSEANGETFGIEVTDGMLHAAGDTSGRTTIVCGSTDQYIKTHYTEDGLFDNTDLWFFDEAAALEYAGTLTGAIESCVEEPATPTMADIISSAGGSNSFELSVDSTTGNYEGLELRKVTYDVDSDTTSGVEWDVQSDGALIERPLNLENGLVLAPESGWSSYKSSGSVTSVNGDGSIDLNLMTTGDEIYSNQHVNAEVIDVSGQAIALYLVDDRIDYDPSELVGGAVFSEGAEAYRTTYILSEDIYLIAEADSCADPTDYNSFCNAVYHFTGDGNWGSDGIATTTDNIISATAADPGTVSLPGGGIGLNALRLYGGSGAPTTAVELVNGGTANIYDIDGTGAATKQETTTIWEQRTVNGETFYRLVLTDALRASMNIPEHVDLTFTEYTGYVRIGGLRPKDQAFEADKWGFNEIAAQDVLDNFEAPFTPTLADIVSSTGGSNAFELSVDPTTGNYEGLELRKTSYDVDSGTTSRVEWDVQSDGALIERPLNVENGLVLAPESGWSSYKNSGSVTSVNGDGSLDLNVVTTGDEIYTNLHSTAEFIDVSGQAIAPYLVNDRIDYDPSELVGGAVFSEGAEAHRFTYIHSEDTYYMGESDGCADPTDFNSFCNAVYHFTGDGDWNTNGSATTATTIISATAADPGAVSLPGGGSQLNALRLYGGSGAPTTAVELVDGGTANIYDIDGTGAATKGETTTWEQRTVNGETFYRLIPTDALRASMNIAAYLDLTFTEYTGYVRIGLLLLKDQAFEADRWSFNEIAVQDVLANFSEPVADTPEFTAASNNEVTFNDIFGEFVGTTFGVRGVGLHLEEETETLETEIGYVFDGSGAGGRYFKRAWNLSDEQVIDVDYDTTWVIQGENVVITIASLDQVHTIALTNFDDTVRPHVIVKIMDDSGTTYQNYGETYEYEAQRLVSRPFLDNQTNGRIILTDLADAVGVYNLFEFNEQVELLPNGNFNEYEGGVLQESGTWTLDTEVSVVTMNWDFGGSDEVVFVFEADVDHDNDSETPNVDIHWIHAWYMIDAESGLGGYFNDATIRTAIPE